MCESYVKVYSFQLRVKSVWKSARVCPLRASDGNTFRDILGRDVDITHLTDIIADVAIIRKQFTEEGTTKPHISDYDQKLLVAITALKEVMHKA